MFNISLPNSFQALTNRLKYSLNENDQESDVNVEVLNEGQTSLTSTLSASADE